MPDKPVLVRNLSPGCAVFTTSEGALIKWEGCGHPEGEDVQPVPADVALGDVSFLRAMGKGVFGVDSENADRVKTDIAAAVARFSRAKPAEPDDETMTDQERKFGKLTVFEMNEETTKQGKIGQDREDRIPVSVEPLQRG